MAGNTTLNTLIKSGNRYDVVVLDMTNGTKVTHALTDTLNSLTATTVVQHAPAEVSMYQRGLTRELFVGDSAGRIAMSVDGGATWTSRVVSTSGITALASGDTAVTDYPLAYAGDSAGKLWAYAPDQNTTGLLGTWTQVASVGAFSIRSLAVPKGGQGRVWVGDDNGMLWLYSPLAGGLSLMADVGGQFLALVCLNDHTCVFGVNNQVNVGLFQAVEASVGATILSFDATRTYTFLSGIGHDALMATTTSGDRVWSPDAGQSLGVITAGIALGGPHTACALSPFDGNEWLIANSAGVQATHDNGATMTGAVSLAGIAWLECDKDHEAVVYCRTATSFGISYDFGLTWDLLSPTASSVTAVAQGALIMA